MLPSIDRKTRLIGKNKLIEKHLPFVQHQQRPAVLFFHNTVHTASSAGSRWLLYTERHNMVTMVTYVEEQT